MSISGSSSCDTMPSRQRVLDEVKRIVAESSGVTPEELREGHTLLRDLPWDSLDEVECAMEIEEHFGISVPDELMEQAKTIGDIVDGVLKILAQPEAGC